MPKCNKEKMRRRSDYKKSVSAVAKEALKNPLQTQKEIAEKTGLSIGNVNDKLNRLESTKDDRILGITDKDLSIVELGQNEIIRRFQDTEELSKMRTVEISQVASASERRYQIFRGDVTNKDGGLKSIDLSDKTLDELDRIRKELLDK